MKKLTQYLNYAGLGLIFVSFVALKIWPYKKIAPLVLAALGTASLVAYILLNISELKQGFKRKSFIYSSNLIVIVLLVLGILVLINYFFARHHYRFDFTQAKLHSLSDQSVQVLRNLKNDIRTICFFRDDNFTKSKMENLMKNYAYHSKKIKFEFIDPDKNPGLVKRYEVTEDGTTIFESGDKESRISSVNEEDITNVLIQVSREKKKSIFFLEGHGEKSCEETGDNGYSIAKSEMEKLGYEVSSFSLALEDTFPKSIDLLIVAGPEKDLLPQELVTIRNYLQNGGKAFFMADPEQAPGLSSFLGEFGLVLEDDLIVDTVSRLLGGDYFMPVVSEYETHPITRKFRYATFFPYARSVEKSETIPEGISVETLAKSSPNSWAEKQLTDPQVSFDKEKDKAGPVALAAVVTIEGKKAEGKLESGTEAQEDVEEEEAKPEGRLAVFGDSDFVSNRYYYLSGNGNFFLNTVNWLTEEADLISIQSKTSSPRTIHLTPSQGRLIFFVSVIILPLVVLLAGILVWARRRAL